MKPILSAAIAVATAAGLAGSAQAALIYGLTVENQILQFDSATPNVVTSSVFVNGLQPNEKIFGIDIRPSDLNANATNDVGVLYGVGSSNRLYTINPDTGAATAVGGPFTPSLNGVEFGFDFNPTIDRIRLVSDTGRNLVLNPDTGAVQLVATPLMYSDMSQPSPSVSGSAYTNNFPGATTSQLYAIDSVRDLVSTQNNNGGVLTPVGPLGVDVSSLIGFDILGVNTAFASLSTGPADTGTLYSLALGSGTATSIGKIGGGTFIRDITVAIPEPGAALAAAGVAGALFARRRKA